MAGQRPHKNRLDFIDPPNGEMKKAPKEAYIKNTPNGGGSPLTPQEQVERLNYWIQGMTQAKPMGELIAGFLSAYNLHNKGAAMYWRNRALDYLCSTQVEDMDKFKAVQRERLTDLYKRCIDAGQFKTAESVLDTLNKLMGVYKQDNVIVAPITQFNFGDERINIANDPDGNAEKLLNYFTTGELVEGKDDEWKQ